MLIRKLFLFPRYCAMNAHQTLCACNNDVYFQAVRKAPEAFARMFLHPPALPFATFGSNEQPHSLRGSSYLHRCRSMRCDRFRSNEDL